MHTSKLATSSSQQRVEARVLILLLVVFSERLDDERQLQLHRTAFVQQLSQEVDDGCFVDLGTVHVTVEQIQGLQQGLLRRLQASSRYTSHGAQPESLDDKGAELMKVGIDERNDDVLLHLLEDV